MSDEIEKIEALRRDIRDNRMFTVLTVFMLVTLPLIVMGIFLYSILDDKVEKGLVEILSKYDVIIQQ